MGYPRKEVSAACASLGFYDVDELSFPDRARLAFRELGMATGLRALESTGRQNDGNGQTRSINRERLLPEVENLKSYEDLTDQIEAFWLKEEDRQVKSWTGHEDINAVMLATSLAPDTFLEV